MQSPLCFITAVQRLGKSCIAVRTPSLLMRLITRATSLDTFSMLLKRFPRCGFFNFGNKSKAGGLMSGMYGGWGSTWHPYFSKISDTAPEACGHALLYDRWSLREIWLQSVSPFQGSVLQNRDHVARQYTHTLLYWSLAHNCRENQNDCIILLAAQAQCAELLKWRTYNEVNHSVLNWNFSKEQSMLPEDDHMIETCRSVLSVLM